MFQFQPEQLFVSSELAHFYLKSLFKQEGKFSNGEDLIDTWDQAHVYDAKARTAVQRHRLRQRFVEQYLFYCIKVGNFIRTYT